MTTSFAATTELQPALDDEELPLGGPVERPRRTLLIASALMLSIVAPLVVGLVALHSPHWHPGYEYAQTELHVRDVGSSHPPLTGLVGRLGEPQDRGSHPGPLSFYALAPGYRLFGSSPWALQVATVILHLAGVATALLIGYRRGGRWLMALTAATMAVLLRFYGAVTITEPWNPYLPLVWWLVFVLAVWSVVEDDLPMLPVAVVAGSFCAQTHISYVGLAGGLTAWAVAAVLVRAVRRRKERRQVARRFGWLAVSAVGGAMLWLPPIVDEARGTRGNLSVLVDYFTSGSTAAPIGARQAMQVLVANLDPWRLLTDHAIPKAMEESPRWSVAGLLFLTAWVLTIVVAWRIRHWPLVRLHVTIGIGLALGVLQTSRIFGAIWQWLLLWAWGAAALMMFAVAWTAAAVVGRRPSVSRSVRLAGIGALAVASLGAAVALTTDTASVESPDVANSRALRHLIPDVVAAIDDDGNRRPDDRYLITWTDPVGVVGELQGFGLVNELDRRGVQVGLAEDKHLRAAPRLTMSPEQATAVLHLAFGRAIDEWDAKPGTRLIAQFDPRSPGQRARQDRLRDELHEELVDLGGAELVDRVESSFLGYFFVLRADPDTPDRVPDLMAEIIELGTPSAIFLER